MDFLQRYKKWFIIGLMALSVVMMAFTGRNGYQQGFLRSAFGTVVTSGQSLFSSIGNWFSDRWNFFTSMNQLHHENQRLLSEIDRLEAQLAQQLHLQEQVRNYAELLNMRLLYDDYAMLGADVISHNPSNWSSTVIINRGANDGISVGMAVIASGGFAGRIESVGPNYSVVAMLIEDAVAVSAQSRRTGELGIVRGDVNLSSYGLLRMNYITETADINIGDEIITSSISSMFPPGILIGRVEEVGTVVGGMRYAIIRPAVDFSSVTSVLIITDIFD